MGLFSDVFGGGKAAKGARRASDLAEQQYRETAPYRQLGRDAIERLRGTYITGETPYTESPGYDFRRGETEKAINRMMASRGLYGSGRRGRELSRYADNLASQEYDQGFNRLAAMAGIGQTGQQMAGQALGRQGGYEMAGGQARQSAYDRSSGAAINTLAGLWGMYG